MRSSFTGYYIARQATSTARSQLEITGQNISNVNTKGYTRQRADTYAMGSMAGKSTYAAVKSDYIGTGVNVSQYSQARDPYLDLRYRQENAKYGDSSARLAGLNEVGYVLDDASTDALNTQLNDFIKQLQTLSGTPSDIVSQGIVRSSAETFVQLLNQYAGQIKNAKKEVTSTLQDGAIREVNNYLSGIAQLNKAIRSAHISGDPALEMQDERNTLIDNLSTYLDISVSTRQVDVGGGVMVDELMINLRANNGDMFELIDNDQFAQLEFIQKDGLDGTATAGIQLLDFDKDPVMFSKNGSITLANGEITNCLTNGALRGYAEIINSGADFDNPPTSVKGIAYYEKMLDTFANRFAELFNAANSTDTENKPLFSTSDGSAVITAQNICISDEWSSSEISYITNTKQENSSGIDYKTDNTNILYMISLLESKTDFNITTAAGDHTVFSGTFNEFATNLSTTLGLQIDNYTSEQKIYTTSLNDIETNRMSTSGVNIDEEAINMVMYNQSFAAASRFMTTIDEIIDNIINKMGLVGR